jgi:hypothetical protein
MLSRSLSPLLVLVVFNCVCPVFSVVVDVTANPLAHPDQVKNILASAANHEVRLSHTSIKVEGPAEDLDEEKLKTESTEEVVRRQHDAVSAALDDMALASSVDDLLAKNPDAIATGDVLEDIDEKNETVEYFHGDSKAGNDCHSVEGDMVGCGKESLSLLQSAARDGKRWAGNLWSPGDIKFCFEEGVPEVTRKAFHAAVQHIQNMVPCVDFAEILAGSSPEKCESNPSVFVKGSDAGCWSYVGMSTTNVINLDPNGCGHLGLAVHELCHAIGMMHEQSRADRDKHVRILWMNVQADMESQFKIDENVNRESPNSQFDSPYDLMSIMHYDSEAFTKVAGQKTIEPLGTTRVVMGNRMGLTESDAEQIAEMYGCSMKKVKPMCTNDPGLCTNEPCVCRQDNVSPLGIIKVKHGECRRCVVRCPRFPHLSDSDICDCPSGEKKDEVKREGSTMYTCNSKKIDGSSKAGH